MDYDFAGILPFWILGFPLVLAVISLVRLPKHTARTYGDDEVGGTQAHRTR